MPFCSGGCNGDGVSNFWLFSRHAAELAGFRQPAREFDSLLLRATWKGALRLGVICYSDLGSCLVAVLPVSEPLPLQFLAAPSPCTTANHTS